MDCFFCKGSLEESTTTHVVTLDNCVIIIKNVPCTTCTQCGESYYDDDVVGRLEEIVKSITEGFVTEVAIVEYTKAA